MTKFCLAAVLLCSVALSARAAPLVVVADFDFIDSSGEARDQTAQHETRVRELKAEIIAALGKSGRFTGGALQCAQPVCSADALDQDRIAASSRRQQATYVVFGGVHKVSTLIQFGQVVVMEAATGRSVLSRAITFRGDDQAAWQHAGGFISQMLIDDLR